MEQCCECNKWQYSDRIAQKYGEGTGLCIEDKEPKGCNRTACLLFEENNQTE